MCGVLPALGVAIGMAAMVAVVGLSTSTRAELNRRLSALGTNLISAEPGSGFYSERATLPTEALPAADRGPGGRHDTLGVVNRRSVVLSSLMKANGQVSEQCRERILVVERFVRDHMDEPLEREVLAAIAGFSVPHFHRLFRACTGQSAAGYVRRERLRRAARKLRIGAVDITAVALAAGYQSHAAFGKAFKQQFGLSPSEFRALGCGAATQLLRNNQ